MTDDEKQKKLGFSITVYGCAKYNPDDPNPDKIDEFSEIVDELTREYMDRLEDIFDKRKKLYFNSTIEDVEIMGYSREKYPKVFK